MVKTQRSDIEIKGHVFKHQHVELVVRAESSCAKAFASAPYRAFLKVSLNRKRKRQNSRSVVSGAGSLLLRPDWVYGSPLSSVFVLKQRHEHDLEIENRAPIFHVPEVVVDPLA